MKKKYQKPMARGLAGISAAEGACYLGAHASGSACTTGESTQWCSSGSGVASITGYPSFCLPAGSTAANCLSGSHAGG